MRAAPPDYTHATEYFRYTDPLLFCRPIDGSAFPTDPRGAHPEGRDPSTITNFNGFVGQVDLTFSGMATDTKTGTKASYSFHTDTRFMKGQFVASNQKIHEGAFAFI